MNGHFHPITKAIDKASRIFLSLGFDVVDGPELESEWYNFDALNVPRDHPSRDMQDTFIIKDSSLGERSKTEREQAVLGSGMSLGYVLRTHTSGVQVRTIERWVKEGKDFPIAVVVPGKVFRNEATDARHEAQFFQIEGLMVGKDITLAHLKGILEKYFSAFLEKEVAVRLRSSFFPFVEPAVEVDMQCFKCSGTGLIARGGQGATPDQSKTGLGGAGTGSCSVCSSSGWIEIMGAGMIHPNVLQNAGLNPREYQGFAFGGGLDRLVMLQTGIDDIRMLYNGDLRLVNQF